MVGAGISQPHELAGKTSALRQSNRLWAGELAAIMRFERSGSKELI
jgi:hypothetical protein